MRGLTRRWVFRRPPPQDATPRPPLLERVLEARGLRERTAVRRFCEPKLTDLHDPGLLPDIDAAAGRLAAAVRNGEPIAVYGDYDVDGITASAILFHVIRAADPRADVRLYVPHRLEEGYGINAAALRRLREQGARVVVSVDCGATAVEPARLARDLGLDLIITDHHHLPPDGALPDALAVVHPRRAGSAYPFGELCGAGVAFKLAWRFATTWCGSQRVARTLQQVLLEMLPLAALGTIADVVPLLDENRTLVSFGLKWIRRTTIPGLRALLEASDLMNESIDTQKVGFILAPRLNACGRMGHAADAVRLLTDAPPPEARAIARRLAAVNRTRQDTERRIAEHAAQLAEDAGMTADDCRVIVLADDSWHAGVVGIVCSRLVERFGRPVVLLRREGDRCRGSARSIRGYSIVDGLGAVAAHLERYGGHDAAAGLTVRTAALPAFVEALTEHANARIPVERLTPGLDVDCDASPAELELEQVTRIAALSPFGPGNPHPSVLVERLALAEGPRQMGANGRHLSLSLRGEVEGRRRYLRGVWFGAGDLAADLAAGMQLDAVIEPKINRFNGRTSVEGIVRDVRVSAGG